VSTPPFDAIVIAPVGELAKVRVCGLTLHERTRRVAVKAGATRVHVTSASDTAESLAAWAAQGAGDLVVVDATDHVVHVPLIQTALKAERRQAAARVPGSGAEHGSTGPSAGPLTAASSASASSVSAPAQPAAAVTDPETGAFAGALVVDGVDRVELAKAAASHAAFEALAASWRTAGVATVAHGELSRHPARTPAERRAAIHFLFGLIRKAQDTWLVRTINRKVSYPFTRLLLPVTGLSPNMISIIVFIIGAIGCVIMTTPTYTAALIGASLLLFAGYLDGCDGEIARIRLESSKLGAWIDTIADEVTTILSVTCWGIHVYNKYPSETWLVPVVIGSTILATVAVGSVYYYLLTSGIGSGNSQDYPTSSPILNFLRLFIRREVINLGTMLMVVLGLVDVLYAILVVGAIVSSSILVIQQVMRVAQKRAVQEPARAP